MVHNTSLAILYKPDSHIAYVIHIYLRMYIWSIYICHSRYVNVVFNLHIQRIYMLIFGTFGTAYPLPCVACVAELLAVASCSQYCQTPTLPLTCYGVASCSPVLPESSVSPHVVTFLAHLVPHSWRLATPSYKRQLLATQ